MFALQKGQAPKQLQVQCKPDAPDCNPNPSFMAFSPLSDFDSKFGGRFCIGESLFDSNTMIEISSWDNNLDCEAELQKEFGICCAENYPSFMADGDSSWYGNDYGNKCLGLDEEVNCLSFNDIENGKLTPEQISGAHPPTTWFWSKIGPLKQIDHTVPINLRCEIVCPSGSSSSSDQTPETSSSSSFKCPPQDMPSCDCGMRAELDANGCPVLLCKDCSSSTEDRCSEIILPLCDCGYRPIFDANNCLSYECIECPEDPPDPGYGPYSSTSAISIAPPTPLPPQYSSVSSVFVEIPEVPDYTQTSLFGNALINGKIIPDTSLRVYTDKANSGGMTNNNTYYSTHAVSQTMLDKNLGTNQEEFLLAFYREPIEFTHVRIGPPPCHVYYNTSANWLNPHLASGAINGKPSMDMSSCDGSYYIGASIHYTLDKSTWDLLGNTTESVFLDVNRKVVKNEYIGDFTVKNAIEVKVADNGNYLGISEFIPVFISDRMITITAHPNFVMRNNGADFAAKVTANITYGQITYKWQKRCALGAWADILGDVGLSGMDTDTLIVTPDIPAPGTDTVEYNYSGCEFRCVLSAPNTLSKKSVPVTFVMPNIVYGCTSPTATNYNANAQVDDGSCTEP